MNMQYFHLLLLNICSLDLAWTSCHFFPPFVIAAGIHSTLVQQPVGVTSTERSRPISFSSRVSSFSHRTVPPEISPMISGCGNGQMWLNWHLTSTRTTQKTSSAAWMWKQPSMASILCPMICAVTLQKRCWSECKTPENSWYFYFLSVTRHRIWWIHWGIKFITVLSSCSHTVPP